MLTILFTILHVLVSVFLILVVLAQQGKGQDLASAFGGGGSQTAFGARGTATLLNKITAGAAALFVVTSLTLGYLRPVVSQNSVIPDTPPADSSAPTQEQEPSVPGDDAGTEGTEGTTTEPGPPSEGEGEPEPPAQGEGAESPPPQPQDPQ